MSDTIAALASGRIPAGVAVIRISGPQAFPIVDRVTDKPCTSQQSSTAQLTTVCTAEEQRVIDHALRIVFKAPRSFTGEDVVELHIHGGLVVIDEVLELLYSNGARPANRGEFSERAFINGKIDLTQAEAISDIITAPTREARKLASLQLGGLLSNQIKAVESLIQNARVLVEASIDFPEDVGDIDQAKLNEIVSDALNALYVLQRTARRGHLVRNGARVVLVGAPNVGKSSLLNALAGRDRAIVSPIAGTTRDTIDIQVDLKGIPVTLTDTAGIRDSADEIERIGIDRTYLSVSDADIVLALSCHDSPPIEIPDVDDTTAIICVHTKADLVHCVMDSPDTYPVSSVTGEGLDALSDIIVSKLMDDTMSALSTDAIAINARHSALIGMAIEALNRFRIAVNNEIPADLLAVELHDAALHLASISGRNVIEAMHREVFSRFCIGK